MEQGAGGRNLRTRRALVLVVAAADPALDSYIQHTLHLPLLHARGGRDRCLTVLLQRNISEALHCSMALACHDQAPARPKQARQAKPNRIFPGPLVPRQRLARSRLPAFTERPASAAVP